MGASQEPPSPASCLSCPLPAQLWRAYCVPGKTTDTARPPDPTVSHLGTQSLASREPHNGQPEPIPRFTNDLKQSEEPLRCPSPLFRFKMVSVPESCPGVQLLRASVYQEPSSGSRKPRTTLGVEGSRLHHLFLPRGRASSHGSHKEEETATQVQSQPAAAWAQQLMD